MAYKSVSPEEQQERYRMRESERLKAKEKILSAQLIANEYHVTWVLSDHCSCTCQRCGERLTWTAILLPETFEARLDFFKVHAHCEAMRSIREDIL